MKQVKFAVGGGYVDLRAMGQSANHCQFRIPKVHHVFESISEVVLFLVGGGVGLFGLMSYTMCDGARVELSLTYRIKNNGS